MIKNLYWNRVIRNNYSDLCSTKVEELHFIEDLKKKDDSIRNALKEIEEAKAGLLQLQQELFERSQQVLEYTYKNTLELTRNTTYKNTIYYTLEVYKIPIDIDFSKLNTNQRYYARERIYKIEYTGRERNEAIKSVDVIAKKYRVNKNDIKLNIKVR